MPCPYCQLEHDVELQFCPETGYRLRCSTCDSVLSPGFKFCTTCGTPLPNIPLEPIEELGELVESPEAGNEAASIPEQPPVARSPNGPAMTAGVNSGGAPENEEQPIPVLARPDDQAEIGEPVLQEEGEEAGIMEPPIETQEKVPLPEKVDDIDQSEPVTPDPTNSNPSAQLSCYKCGSVLVGGLRFCTICGAPSPAFPLEPVEQQEDITGAPLQILDETSRSITPPLEPETIQEQVEGPEAVEEPEQILEQTPAAAELARAIEPADVDTRKPLSPIDASADPEGEENPPNNIFIPILPEAIEENAAPESNFKEQSELQKSALTLEKVTPEPSSQAAQQSDFPVYKYCMKCGSVLPPGAHFCPFCGFTLPIGPKKNRPTILFAIVGSVLLCAAILLLVGFGLILLGIGTSPFDLSGIPFIANVTPLAWVFGEKTAAPQITSVAVKGPTAAATRSFMVSNATPDPPPPPSPATIIPSPTPVIPTKPPGPITPGGTLSSPQPTVAVAPCISYYDEDNKYLKLACQAGKTWEIEIVDNSADVGLYSSIAFDENKNAYISYFDQGNKTLKFAHKSAGKWTIETVDSEDVGLFTSLVLDHTGNPWISYYDRANGTLKLAQGMGNNWNIFTVDAMAPEEKRENENYKTSLALDSKGNPLIAYHHYGEDVAKLAHWTGSKWNIQTIDPVKGSGQQCSLAVDSRDNPGVSYYDSKEQNLKYARWVDSQWEIEVADKGHKVGIFSSLVYDSQDFPHISYFDDTNDNLKYTFWSGRSWVTQLVDTYHLVGFYSSLALDKNDRPFIAYYYYSGGDMRVGNYDGEGWVIKNVDSTGKVGLYPSIKFMVEYQ